MRLAICLSGQPRTWRHTHESLFKFFHGHELDVFIHTWDDVEATELAAVKAAYSPRVISLTSRPLFLEEKQAMAARFPVSPPLTILDMFYSMAASVNLALKAGTPAYDLICRTRFDTIYQGVWRGAAPPKGAIAVQTGEFEPPGGCNDQFALGEPEVMHLYAGISDWLPKGMERLTPPWFRPEIALKAYLSNVCGLTLHRERFALTLLRDDQVGQPFSAIGDDPLHHARKREDWEAFAKTHMAPEITAKLDFRYAGRLPLMIDRWLHAKPPEARRAILTGDWVHRIVAIDAVLREETRGVMDANRYRLVRLIDAALLNRTSRDEPICLESFIVHALSANLQDMKKALAWALEDRSRLVALDPVLDRLPTLGAAYRFAQPFLQQPLQRTAALTFAAKRSEAQHLVESARTVIQPYVDAAQSGAMAPEEAKAKALATLKAIHYDGKNYIFAYQGDGVTLLVPDKTLIGKNRIDVVDAHNFQYVKAFINTAQSGGGFVSYFFPKAGSTKAEPKISYVLSVPAWDWVVGSGIYVDDVMNNLIGAGLQVALIIVPLLLGFAGAMYWVGRSVSTLIGGLTRRMRSLAEGDLDSPIVSQDRHDEIGQMAEALTSFRLAAIEKANLEASQSALSSKSEAERNRNEAERTAARQAVETAVAALAKALSRLSEGDLTYRLNQPFASDYEPLRHDFNVAMDKLEDTLSEIAAAISGLHAGAGEVAHAADDMSRRTEQQAASLEETAAALDQITATMRKSADGAGEAAGVMVKAGEEASASKQVVADAVDAMKEIEASSNQIRKIIGVIDEIAFQTNLLALNAGVEAARAGDAGRGFAVVASEVRALAQRSAEAAKEIKALISASSAQVQKGVGLVDRTGQSLERLLDLVHTINDRVAAIAASAQEQATGLREVNSAVNQMDQVTQQNAAMVEQSTATSQTLANESDVLARLVQRFTLRDRAVAQGAAARRAA